VIQQNPDLFLKSKLKNGLPKCVVTRQTSVYYSFNKFKIYILTVFDNRQDPDSLEEEINKMQI